MTRPVAKTNPLIASSYQELATLLENWNGPGPYPNWAPIAQAELAKNSIRVSLPTHGRSLQAIREKMALIGQTPGIISSYEEKWGYHIHTITYRSM